MADNDRRALDRERFEDIYREHFDRVAAYLLARANRDWAADALSKTFEVAWRRIADVPSEPLPWLIAVARRVLADLRRSERRQGALVTRIASTITETTADPSEALAGREHTLAALTRLSDPQQEALLLIAWDGLSQREAAAALGCSRGAIALRLHRARASLLSPDRSRHGLCGGRILREYVAQPRIVIRVLRSCCPILTTAAIASLLATGCAVSAGSASPHSTDRVVAPRSDTHASHRVRRVVLLGHSVEHRPIRVQELGEPFAGRRVLIVGCIHGDERAGIAVTRRLDAMVPPQGIDLWVLDDLNPDGAATDTRQNARGVDLNRNFPYGWRPAGQPGDQQYPGSGPLSEPEAGMAYRLILRLHPQITIFFHQPLGLIDESGGDPRVERRFAQLSGLALRRLTRYPGSAVGWQNHRLPISTAFVVELPPGRLTPQNTSRLAQAVLALAHGLSSQE